MRTTIDLPEPLLDDLRQRASELGVTLSEIVQEALTSHLARKAARGGSKFKLHTVRGRLVRPDLDLDRPSSLSTLDDESDYTGNRA
jgi:hypothetical protein